MRLPERPLSRIESPDILDSDSLMHAALSELPGRAATIAEAYKIASTCDARWSRHGEESARLRANLLACKMPLLSEFHSAPLPTHIGGKIVGWTFVTALDYTTGEHHAALVYGDLGRGSLGNGKDVLVRIHSASKLNDNFFGLTGNSDKKMEASMNQIVDEGRGIILYLQHDGCGHGVVSHLDSLKRRFEFNKSGAIQKRQGPNGAPVSLAESFLLAGQSPDARNYEVCSEFLTRLGVDSARILTGRPSKIDGIDSIPVVHEPAPWAGAHSNGSQINIESEISHGTFDNAGMLPPIELERIRMELEAHCRELDAVDQMPWTTVARRRAILESTGHPIVSRLGIAPAPTRFGDWSLAAYGDYTTGEVHRVLVYGNAENGALPKGKEVPIRLHSSCETNEVLRSTNCECRAELSEAMERIKDNGYGAILYLEQEGRGAGRIGKMAQLRGMFEFEDDGVSIKQRIGPSGNPVSTYQAYVDAGYPAEARDFSVAGAMLKDLEIDSVEIFTNNPRKINGVAKHVKSLRPSDIIAQLESLADPELVRSELIDKSRNLGHVIPKEKIDLDS